MNVIELVLSAPCDWCSILPTLRTLGGIHRKFMIPTWTYPILGKAMVMMIQEKLGSAMDGALPVVVHVIDLVVSIVSFPHLLVVW